MSDHVEFLESDEATRYDDDYTEERKNVTNYHDSRAVQYRRRIIERNWIFATAEERDISFYSCRRVNTSMGANLSDKRVDTPCDRGY